MKKISIRFRVNGEPIQLSTEPNRTLLQILREDLGLTGTKNGCETGECGACTVIVDGQAMNSCLILAGQVNGMEIETIEGLVMNGKPHPLQTAFVEAGAVQCGFCTPGMIMASKALLDKNPHPTRSEIQQALSGNLCRCTGYTKIFEAVEKAPEELTHE